MRDLRYQEFFFMKLSTLAVAAALVLSGRAFAAPIALDFEGVGDLQAVGNFYNASYGITFSRSALGLVDSDAGGSGSFENEPSPSTVLFFTNGDVSAIMNRVSGFINSVSLGYSSLAGGSVSVFSGANGTGNLLATMGLTSQGTQGCNPTINDALCNFSPVALSFAGTAQSIVFAGTADNILFDNINVTLAVPGGSGVPEPATAALALVALASAAVAGRKSALKS